MGEDDGQLAVTLERPLTGQALEEDAAERVDVCTTVDRAALDLLRRHVSRACRGSRGRRSGCSALATWRCEAEVADGGVISAPASRRGRGCSRA